MRRDLTSTKGEMFSIACWNISRGSFLLFSFALIKEKSKKEPLEIFQHAMENISPFVEVRSRRIGGATYQVPVEVKGNRKFSLALRWLLAAARSQKGKPMAQKLAEEILLASKKEGTAFRKKEETHRMADANRAFAHFA